MFSTRFDQNCNFEIEFDHFRLNMHFIHVKPTKTANKKVVPLLLLHGWPGSVREFYDFIGLLKNQRTDSKIEFDIIVPSLPGYGFSQGSSKTGFGVLEMSVVLRNLMIRLGYEKFYIQGGDWGSALGSTIATLFPQNVFGYHSNMCIAINSVSGLFKTLIASNFPSYFVEKEYEDFHFPYGEKISGIILESGYMHLQATKPDTIGENCIIVFWPFSYNVFHQFSRNCSIEQSGWSGGIHTGKIRNMDVPSTSIITQRWFGSAKGSVRCVFRQCHDLPIEQIDNNVVQTLFGSFLVATTWTQIGTGSNKCTNWLCSI